MKSVAFFLSALVFVHSAFAGDVAKIPIPQATGPVREDSYIVHLKPGANKDAHLASLSSLPDPSESQVLYNYDLIPAYAATLKGAALELVQTSPDVDFIENDHILSASFVRSPRQDDSPPPVSSPVPVSANPDDGEGVDVYGIDTGINIQHVQFGGRARWGATFGGYNDTDDNGHGTHTAGIAVGATFGTAPGANVIAIKVLNKKAYGPASDVIAGVNWAVNAAVSSGRPSVINMSIGNDSNGPYKSVDAAVTAGMQQGVHFAVSAGNDDQDVSVHSPADTPGANTVGAVDGNNVKAYFSNYGPMIVIWAPGVNIESAWWTGPNDTEVLSGTSQSAPYVAGILATVVGKCGQISPAELTAQLKTHALPVVTGIDSNTTNLLAVKW